MSEKPTTLLPSKITQLISKAVDEELEHKSYEPGDVERQRKRILNELVSAYTAVERRIAEHKGLFSSRLFRDGLVDCFEKVDAISVPDAEEIVAHMLYEFQLKQSRKAS